MKTAVSPTTDLATRLYRGDYATILAETVDGARGGIGKNKLWIVVGALCFKGRIEEAELHFRDSENELSSSERIQCRFFLGISRTRLGQYEKGRKYLIANLKELKDSPRALSPVAVFFVQQGLAFYRYFSGKLVAAEKSSARSFAAALRGDFLYGRVLSSDIRGHILSQLGQASAGVETLKQAAQLATKLGNGSVPSSIAMSIALYEAQYGLNPTNALDRIENLLRNIQVQDTYSESTLLLELVRQNILRGRVSAARPLIDRAAQVIYSTQNRRHEIVLNLRYAYLAFVSGELAQALSFVRAGKKTLDARVDQMFEIELLGLERKLVIALGMTDKVGTIEAKLEQKSTAFGGGVNQRILARTGLGSTKEFRRNLDPMGDLLTEIRALPRDEAIERVLASGYHIFLYEILGLSAAKTVLYLDLKPGTVTSLYHGNVIHQEGLSPLTRKLLFELSKKSCSKKELVEKLWAYDYHPLRHDPVVYSAVTSARRLLGEFSAWIVTTEDGYHLLPGVELRFPDFGADKPVQKKPDNPIEQMPSESALNYRQLKILRLLKTTETTSVKHLVKMFKISEITASRDLACLKDNHLVVRIGRGRATEYALPGNI